MRPACSKAKYNSQREANSAVRNAFVGGSLRRHGSQTYFRWHCGKWHIGSAVNRSALLRRERRTEDDADDMIGM
jgi:hypothetical protein